LSDCAINRCIDRRKEKKEKEKKKEKREREREREDGTLTAKGRLALRKTTREHQNSQRRSLQFFRDSTMGSTVPRLTTLGAEKTKQEKGKRWKQTSKKPIKNQVTNQKLWRNIKSTQSSWCQQKKRHPNLFWWFFEMIGVKMGPDFFHIIPICDYTMLHGMGKFQNAAMLLSLFAHFEMPNQQTNTQTRGENTYIFWERELDELKGANEGKYKENAKSDCDLWLKELGQIFLK
jgi:hypothetical protein